MILLKIAQNREPATQASRTVISDLTLMFCGPLNDESPWCSPCGTIELVTARDSVLRGKLELRKCATPYTVTFFFFFNTKCFVIYFNMHMYLFPFNQGNYEYMSICFCVFWRLIGRTYIVWYSY